MNEANRFFERIDIIRIRLDNQKKLIEDSLNDPHLLFDKAAEVFGSTHEPVFQIMNVYEDNTRKMNIHEFQEFLCSIINQYFSSTLDEKRFEIKTRNHNSFPSLFAVYCEGSEIIQFSIFDKFYGTKDLQSQESIQNDYDQNKKIHQETIKSVEAKLNDMIDAKENIVSWIFRFHKKKDKNIINKIFYGMTDMINLLFKRKKVNDYIDKTISKCQKEIEYEKTQFNKYNLIDEKLHRMKILKDAIDIVEPIFVQHGYSLEKERYRLF